MLIRTPRHQFRNEAGADVRSDFLSFRPHHHEALFGRRSRAAVSSRQASGARNGVRDARDQSPETAPESLFPSQRPFTETWVCSAIGHRQLQSDVQPAQNIRRRSLQCTKLPVFRLDVKWETAIADMRGTRRIEKAGNRGVFLGSRLPCRLGAAIVRISGPIRAPSRRVMGHNLHPDGEVGSRVRSRREVPTQSDGMPRRFRKRRLATPAQRSTEMACENHRQSQQAQVAANSASP